MSVKANIRSQYHAALAMLRQAVAECPPELWDSAEHKNRTWNVAVHALFYTHFYLHPTAEDFQPWPNVHLEGRIFDDPSEAEETQVPSQHDVLDFIDFLTEQIDPMVDALDLEAESGFHWLPFNKLELQFYNLRHLVLHTGELAERLWQAGGVEIRWVGMR